MKTSVVHLIWVIIGLITFPIWLFLAFLIMTVRSIHNHVRDATLWLINADRDVQPVR